MLGSSISLEDLPILCAQASGNTEPSGITHAASWCQINIFMPFQERWAFAADYGEVQAPSKEVEIEAGLEIAGCPSCR